ncbi:DNA replication ATP-dependent helicase/nuclease JHS1 [Sesamum angolense]|uniref:DNA replication ATP-dependent helicase/nuclease n=1 Tax=Sesamum angolense TaxID=2727404 RepID=A0AAE2C6L8_9LAMI|nr:DNA replication ATP-dependent helicase/nuclease JHS1 [Sesamum angolense]
MAPRKRTSSGGKKSSHHNQEPLQPSQPSKFGIQHFFERHSQTQKTLSQNSSKRDDNRPPTPISRHAAATNQNPQIVPKPIMNPKLGSNLNHAEVGAENPGGMSKLVKIESMGKYLRGVNPGVNAVNLTKIDANSSVSRNAEFRSDVLVPGCVDMGCGNPGNAFNDRVMDLKNVKKGGNFREVEASSPSQDTPVENVLPVVIDNEENQLEVSPEASKSFSVKRFKFSPGMLIKQSQDDVIDEVTWKISPVNERLHAMSKHLPGRMRVLADSTRINSMDFQQCSQQKVQTSADMAGKLERWLASPPLKAENKSLVCSDGVASRKVNTVHDLNGHGNHRNIKSNDKSEVPNTQSPFSTPPSLSCCHDKALDDVHSNGVPDQLGSRQHKKVTGSSTSSLHLSSLCFPYASFKAVLTLFSEKYHGTFFDQVEDVISVEHSICKDNEKLFDAERRPTADHVVNRLTTISEEKVCTEDSRFSFLVLEVSEKLGPAESSGPQSCCKVLRLLNEQTGDERALQLWDEWYFTVVAPGDTVHVIGEFDAWGTCDVNRDENFLIVHPDILVWYSVSASFSCPRRTILDERLKHSEHSAAALMGTLLHQIFQILTPSNGVIAANENDIWKTLTEAIPKILNWISSFRDSQILSKEPGNLRVANGVIVDIGDSHVSVSFAKRLRLPGHSPGSMPEHLHQQSWRIDKDEVMASFAIMSSHLRKMVVDLEMPRFDSGCIFSQDPAISYIWAEKSLNDDQRRAILKILTAKDYALILGMPGTGKTSTMVHAVKALLMRGASILLTSYTNSAVDNLLLKLKTQVCLGPLMFASKFVLVGIIINYRHLSRVQRLREWNECEPFLQALRSTSTGNCSSTLPDLLAAYETNDRKTLNNPIEAHIIAEVTKALVLRGIERQDIGIITPYNSQANLIQGAVSEPVEIHTIEKYQKKLIMVGSCGTLSRVPLLKLLIEKVEELSGILVVSKKEINYKLELRRCSNLR